MEFTVVPAKSTWVCVLCLNITILAKTPSCLTCALFYISFQLWNYGTRQNDAKCKLTHNFTNVKKLKVVLKYVRY